MRTADEIRAEIERLQPAYKNACMIKHRDPRIELKATIAALTWVLSDPAPIHADPPTRTDEGEAG